MTRSRALSVLGAVVGISVAILIVVRDDAAVDALRSISLVVLAVVLLVQAVNLVTDSIRYHMVLPARFRDDLAMWRWHHIFSVGRLLNLLIPQAGAAYRATRLKLSHGMPISTFFGSVAAITWLGNGVALLAASIAVGLAGEPVPAMLIALAGIGILFGIWLLPRLPWFQPDRGPWSERVRAIVANFGEAFRDLAAGKGWLWRVLGVSVISQLAGLTAYVLVVDALGATDPIVVGAVIYTGTTIATVVSLTPGGLGITELTAGVAGVAVDFGAGPAVLAAFLIRATGVTAVAALALISTVIAPEAEVPPTPDG